MARENWTDDRLDHLSERMDERFDKVDAEMKAGFARVEAETNLRFQLVDQRFDQVDKEFALVREDVRELRVAVTGMQRTMTQSVVAICTIMTTGFATLIGLVAF